MSATDAAKKLCGVCRKNEVDGRNKVCDECKDMSQGVAEIIEPKVVEQRGECKIAGTDKPVDIRCPDCGGIDDGRINPTNKMKLCCWSARMVKGRAKWLSNPTSEHSLVLDFSQYPDLLEDIKQEAVKQLRTPENQALWRLIKCTVHDKFRQNEE